MFNFLAGYRTKLGIVGAIMGGLTLIINGISDEISGQPGLTKVGVGLLGIGSGLSAAGIRWAPEFVDILKALNQVQAGQTMVRANQNQVSDKVTELSTHIQTKLP